MFAASEETTLGFGIFSVLKCISKVYIYNTCPNLIKALGAVTVQARGKVQGLRSKQDYGSHLAPAPGIQGKEKS